MNVLLFTNHSPRNLPPILLSQNEIICGPSITNSKIQGNWKYLSTPTGPYDSEFVFSKLPRSQYPDLIVIHLEPSPRSIPQNLPQNVPTVLILSETQTGTKPLQGLLSYALQSKPDAIVLANRQHCHFFKEFGFNQVFWLPGLIYSMPRPLLPRREKRMQLCYSGQLGLKCPQQSSIIGKLQNSNLPIVGGALPRIELLEMISRSEFSLSISQNGEWTQQVFDSTQIGSVLISDELSTHAGLDIFYKNGQSIVTFNSKNDLIEQIGEYTHDTEKRKSIAQEGLQVHSEFFTWDAKQKAFLALIKGGTTFDVYRLSGEPRCSLPACDPNTKDALILRIQLYEFLQEMHFERDTVNVSMTRGVHPLLMSDLADLVRLNQTIYISEAEFDSIWLQALTELLVSNYNRQEPQELLKSEADLLIVTREDLELAEVQSSIEHKRHSYLLISDYFVSPDSRFEEALSELGYHARKERILGLYELI